MNVISFSLYGSDKRYTWGAVRQARLAAIHYPEWQCWFYIPEDWKETQIKEDLGAMNNVRIIHGSPQIPQMMWRFTVADDPQVKRFICRDTDSRIGPEEAAAVQEWITDDTILHTCRSHPAHGRPINGGMFGVQVVRPTWRAPSFTRAILDFIENHPNPGEYSVDQEFLSRWLWQWAHVSATQHDAVTRQAYPGSKPFPVKWEWPRFMGEVVLIDHETGADAYRDDDWKTLPKDQE